jgi:hypothetical protein
MPSILAISAPVANYLNQKNQLSAYKISKICAVAVFLSNLSTAAADLNLALKPLGF